MIVQVYSAVNLLWILCNSAVINFCQFVLWLLVRPFDNALYRRIMGYVRRFARVKERRVYECGCRMGADALVLLFCVVV